MYEVNDAVAIHYEGLSYITGLHGLTQDYDKALEYIIGRELGHAGS